MTKTIVVGVDGSPTAARAAETAAQLAAGLDGRLVVVSAYGRFEMERVQVGSDDYVITNEDESLEIAERVVAGLRDAGVSVPMTGAAEEGKPAEALVSAAGRFDADVIVVGNKRVQGLARVLGSIATDVARKAPCDVYIAHTHTR